MRAAWLAAAAAALVAACAVSFPETGYQTVDSETGGAGGSAPQSSSSSRGAGASSSSSSGSGGCTTPSDCPAAPECQDAICVRGACGAEPVVADTACSTNGGAFCDGAGSCVECNMAAECTGGAPCMTTSCAQHVCVTSPTMDGTPCGAAALTCQSGVCGGCTSAADCGSDTFCATFSCDGAHACQVAQTEDGTPLPASQQTTGDCHQLVCSSGAAASVVDATDVPTDDGNPCTVGCDATGQRNAPVADGPLPDAQQVHGDCHQIVCQSGVESNVIDVTDTPPSDGNPCTVGCDASGNVNAPLPDGTSCNGVKQCMSGACCDTCTSKNLTCGTLAGANGCPLVDCNDGMKDTFETDVDCGGPTNRCPTRCATGKHCIAPSDCSSGQCTAGTCG